ncbi:TIGR01777 family oxidoreductase [Pseudomaricurvus sp.]|uniref:TIGR01777 family oxidoreductase n=1 Tax=Pseudomaricurvus sp. TaxID=2004510 RepID=UPI003F6B0551
MTSSSDLTSNGGSVDTARPTGSGRVLITGGTGFVGEALIPHLLAEGYECWILTRQASKAAENTDQLHYINALSQLSTPLPELVINLAGEGIADKRWTSHRKTQLMDSRIGVTQSLVEHYRQHEQCPKRVISGSAVGFYGNHDDELLNEAGRCHPGFAHDLCQAWEEEAEKFENLGAVVCCLRIGVVIGADGGIIKKLKPPFLLGAGGQIGTGRQWMSWIHRQDLVRLIIHVLEHETVHGSVNAVSPNPVTNSEFTRLFALQLGRPALLPMPSFVVKLMFGQMGDELLLGGQRVVPEQIVRSGFEFTYPELEAALQQSLESHK